MLTRIAAGKTSVHQHTSLRTARISLGYRTAFAAAFLGTVFPLLGQAESPALQAANQTTWTVYAESAYVGSGDAKFRGVKPGDSDALDFELGIGARIPLNEDWFIPVAVSSHNYFLDSVTGAPVPEEINTLRFNAGLGYHWNEQWTFSVSGGPLLYNLSDVDANDIGFGALLRADYQLNSELTVVMGLLISPDSEYPVLPVAGARWVVRDDLVLNLVFPKPTINYRVNSRLSVFAGGEMRGTTFRTDGKIANDTGVTDFNNALGTYRDFHLGAGAEFRVLKGLSLSVEGGYSLGRQIDYTRIDEKVKFESAPYVQLGVKYRF